MALGWQPVGLVAFGLTMVYGILRLIISPRDCSGLTPMWGFIRFALCIPVCEFPLAILVRSVGSPRPYAINHCDRPASRSRFGFGAPFVGIGLVISRGTQGFLGRNF